MRYPIRSIAAQQTLRFRQKHLWPDMPLEHVKVPGDETAHHLGAFDGQKLIGVASFFAHPKGVQLRKLAVDPMYRKRGLASRMIEEGARCAKKDGHAQLWCDARQSALHFYERLGFKIDPDVFEKSGVTYQIARRAL
ncbi:MAG: GNAT family N-acetyltransferase [Pseudomonadota bacterium]